MTLTTPHQQKGNTVMISNLDPQPPPPVTRKSPNLILHCGADHVDLKEVNKVKTPSPTSSWHPIPHHDLITTVQTTLKRTNLRIGSQAHSLSHGGNRYFGLMEIHPKQEAQGEDYCWILGLRNSHDKMFPAGAVAGASVFVCDNLVRREA